jgi:serine/threonine protein kinase
MEVWMTSPGVRLADRYRLVEQIASGGMGSVWLAWDETLYRRVAVKLLHAQRGLNDEDAAMTRNRVIREARITARLHHPHAVTLYDVIEYNGQPCLILQYVPSRSLSSLIAEQGVLPVPFVARIGADVASALAAAHQVGIVHRDVKPSNVLITPEGSATVTDFGIAHAAGDITLTSTGMVTGTPAFLAPEIARGASSGYPADVFSLGATLYAALEGTPPFGTDKNPMAVLHRVASGEVIPPQRTGLLTDLLVQMLAVDPADRPQMEQVSSRLIAMAQAATFVPLLPAIGGAAEESPATDSSLIPLTSPTPTARTNPTTNGTTNSPSLSVARTTTAQTSTTESRTAETTATSTSHSTSSSANRTSRVTASSSGSAPTSARLAAAVTDYYAMLPTDTDDGWAHLTSDFQSGTARNRAYYQQFWDGVKRVSTSDVHSTGPDSVQATITYHFTDGRTAVEVTDYTLRSEDDVLKIEASQVVRSNTQ